MRDDDKGKRALFGPAPQSKRPEKEEGRRSAFSPAQPVRIECARCGSITGVSVTDVLRRLIRFSLWVPGRTYSRRLRCPACERRSWVRLRFL
jgi:hypothetical protein